MGHSSGLGSILHWPTCDRVCLANVEVGFASDNNVVPAAEGTAHVARPFVQSGRCRALLIGISYRGELFDAHQDVDRYSNVLIGTHAATPLTS